MKPSSRSRNRSSRATDMADKRYLDWPFFEDKHRQLARELDAWAAQNVAAMQCDARVEGDHAVINGQMTWISNGGIADFFGVFCRTGEAPGARGISAFIVDAGTPGIEIAERFVVFVF